MFFLPQGCKSGKRQSGPGSTPLPVVSISSRTQPESTSSGESPWTQPGFQTFLQIRGHQQSSCLFGSVHADPWVSWIESKDCCQPPGLRRFFQLCFPASSFTKWCVYPQNLEQQHLSSLLGWVTLMSPALCWCDCGLSCACKLGVPWGALIFLWCENPGLHWALPSPRGRCA